MGTEWVLPFGLLFAGMVWLVVMLASPLPLWAVDRLSWKPHTCFLKDWHVARVMQSTACLSSAKFKHTCHGNFDHCVVLLHCAATDQNATNSDRVAVWALSSSAIMIGNRDKLSLCSAFELQTNVSILLNPRSSGNSTEVNPLAMVECAFGVNPSECCTSCSELDSPVELDALFSELLVDSIGAPLGLMAAGAALSIVYLCIVYCSKVSPCDWWRERRERMRRERVDRVLELIAAHREVEPAFVAPPPRAPSAPVPPEQHDDIAPGRRRRRRRRAHTEERPAPASPAADGFDAFDTSPSVVKCKMCKNLLADDMLGCTQCERVAPQRMEQIAFSFPGGDVTCTICIEDIAMEERTVTLPCAHQYHLDCIAEWLRNKNSCPQCLSPVVNSGS